MRRWTTILIDFQNLLEKCFQSRLRYSSFLQVDFSAVCAVKGIYFCNQKFSPYDAPQALYLSPPPQQPSLNPNTLNYYDWLELGAQPGPGDENTMYAVLIEKKLEDFEKERDQYEQVIQNWRRKRGKC